MAALRAASSQNRWRSGDRRTLPVAAVAVALLVSPLGVALAAWEAAAPEPVASTRADSASSRPSGPIAAPAPIPEPNFFDGPASREDGQALAAGAGAAAQVLAAGSQSGAGITEGNARLGGKDRRTATPEAVPTTSIDATGHPPTGPAELAPIARPATSLEGFFPQAVDSFIWASSGEDAQALAAGARAAEVGTFTAEDRAVAAGMAEWQAPEQAAADARARAAADFPGQEPLAEGDLRDGAGHYWYFERDGVGTVYWFLGNRSAEFTGAPPTVQLFFLRFPK